MGLFDFLKGSASPSADGLVGSVIHRTVSGSTLQIRQGVKGMAMDGLRALEGDPGAQQRINGLAGIQQVDQFGTPARPTGDQIGAAASGRMRAAYGPQQNGLPQMGMGTQQPATFGDVAAGMFKNLVNSILPQPGGATDRLTRGAVSSATLAAGIAVGGVTAQAGPQNYAPVVDKSTYSAGAIAEAKAAGIDTRNFRLTPEAQPLTAAAPVATPPAAYEEAKTFPVSMPQASTIRPLDATSPAVTTSVTPREDFKAAVTAPAAAAPAPAVQAPVAEFHSRFGDELYARAVAATKPSGPGTGPG